MDRRTLHLQMPTLFVVRITEEHLIVVTSYPLTLNNHDIVWKFNYLTKMQMSEHCRMI